MPFRHSDRVTHADDKKMKFVLKFVVVFLIIIILFFFKSKSLQWNGHFAIDKITFWLNASKPIWLKTVWSVIQIPSVAVTD